MSTPLSHRTAAVLLAVNGLLHLALTPEYSGKNLMVGAGFLGFAAVSAYLAVRLWRHDDQSAWAAAAAVSVLAFAGLVASRTVGLLSFYEPDWEIAAIVSLLLEAGVVGVAAFARRLSLGRRSRPRRRAMT